MSSSDTSASRRAGSTPSTPQIMRPAVMSPCAAPHTHMQASWRDKQGRRASVAAGGCSCRCLGRVEDLPPAAVPPSLLLLSSTIAAAAPAAARRSLQRRRPCATRCPGSSAARCTSGPVCACAAQACMRGWARAVQAGRRPMRPRMHGTGAAGARTMLWKGESPSTRILSRATMYLPAISCCSVVLPARAQTDSVVGSCVCVATCRRGRRRRLSARCCCWLRR